MEVTNITFDRELQIKEISPRWYIIPHEFLITVSTKSSGTIRYSIKPNLRFDGRSGGPLVDWVAPNLGTREEIERWVFHDICFHDMGVFSFKESNRLLDWGLDVYCGYGWWRRKVIYSVVSLAKRAFGRPKPGDREYPNIDKITITYGDR